jgi:xanthine/uracil permease
MTKPPSHWLDGLLRVALMVLAIALALNIAARLIMAVLPILIAGGVVVLIIYAGWSIYQFRRSRW